MKFCVLMGSPREEGNTAALLAPFLEECGALGSQTQVIPLYDRAVNPCLGCMACQDAPDGPGCVQDDDFAAIFQAMADCDVIILATPIYAFFCTAPMKALLDRAIYAGVKNYGREKGPRLLAGKRLAAIATCGYPPERGADLWEEGVKRFCRHGGLEYMGIFCRRDWGSREPFMNEEREQAVRDFAQALTLAVRADNMVELT
ncbi:MAG: flavodoxin family protein [Lawsonibacter sp.]|jgi:putative NADPH-quinone reductase|nr:flavodoxin family protein [Lawsonibacter sp.]